MLQTVWHSRRLSRLRRSSAARAGAAVFGLLLLFIIVVPAAHFDRPLSRVVFARDGSLLSAVTARDQQWRFPPSAYVPGKFAAAIVRIEDSRFYWHPGVDPVAVLRAMRSNFHAKHVVSGASTLSMQVVRLWREGQPRTYGEKLIEVVLAVRLELTRSKHEILAAYAANAPFGGNVVGLDAAAWRYFATAPENLSWAEAAMLAVLPNSPALIHPGRNRDVLLARRNQLLVKLREQEALSTSELGAALAEPLPNPAPLPHLAPHLLMRITAGNRAQARSTLDIELQKQVAAIVERHHQALAGNQVHNLAALVVAVDTGEVLAYVGNTQNSDQHGGYVDIITSPRSTGSVLKPLLFAAAVDAGELLPTELLEDTPLRLGGFAPENFSHTYSGAVPAAAAISRSLNVPSVRLLHEYGVDRFHSLLGRLGMTTLGRPASHYGLSLILGGAEGNLWDLTGVYASLARLVTRAAQNADATGVITTPQLLWDQARPVSKTKPALGAAAAYLMLQTMLEVERPGVEASWRDFAAPRHVAWKTGTSFGFRDAWAVGVTPRHAIGVWAGNADGAGRPGLTGLSAAAPVLFDIVDALPHSGWFSPPLHELVDISVCRHSGQRAGPHCRDTEMIAVPRAGLNGHVCAYCQTLHLDRGERYRVHGDCEPVHAQHVQERFVLPPVMEWFYRMHHADYAPLPPWRPDCAAGLGSASGSLSVIYPRNGSAIYVPLELDGKRGRTVLEATHRDSQATLYWHLDNQYLGMTRDIHQLAVAPTPGQHVLTVVDSNGERIARRFSVLQQKQRE